MSECTNDGPSPLPALTDEELTALAAVTPEDVLRAQQRWREQASPAFRDLLDAAPDDGTAPQNPQEPTTEERP